ncbi:hypothetical protein AXF42_Ash007264 [Apostasia shenzhenica]|uniref:Uncharacterized protein n=1 Tax=Apostasia shenzhenica TaxID=1088818 RepID=A0A2I0B9R6_9ASPA|nr:hypothetical protein AXF42_Ash007264 [Apostasia shenzhenica]
MPFRDLRLASSLENSFYPALEGCHLLPRIHIKLSSPNRSFHKTNILNSQLIREKTSNGKLVENPLPRLTPLTPQ